jgi:hypothetical protein
MSSNINPNNIDREFPVAGQDNDSQGFRDNFTSIKNNFSFASAEISDLQNSVTSLQSIVQIGNDLTHLVGAIEADSDLTVSGNLIVAGNINLSYAEFAVGNLTTSGNVVTNNITTAAGTAGNLTIDPDGAGAVIIKTGNTWIVGANVSTSGNITATGNVTSSANIIAGGFLFANGVNILSSVSGSYSNSNVAAYLPSYGGNLTVGNVSATGGVTITGSLVVTNGIGVTTGITVGGNINATGGNINSVSSSVNLLNQPTTINAFASATTVNIGNASGNTNVTGFLTVSSAIQFANLTTAQINAITPTNRGMTVYNYTTGNVQVYNGTKWANITLS